MLVRRIVDDVDVFVAQLADNAVNSGTFHTYTSPYWVNAVVVGFYGYFSALSWFANDFLDGDEAVKYFWHLQ